MEAYYFELKALHIGAAIASGALFLARALALNLASATWPLAHPVRRLSYLVDSLLLAAAILLAMTVGQYPLRDSWLTAKILLLFAYILLGYRALRGRSLPIRLACLGGAAAAFLFIVTVARAHHPLGFLAPL